MGAPLLEFLQLRFGEAAGARILAQWRKNFSLDQAATPGAGGPGNPGSSAGAQPMPASSAAASRHEEYRDLLALLMAHAVRRDATVEAVAEWIAGSCMGDRHLWEDLGLPERPALTRLMADCFPGLRVLNNRDMRWKKFLYRQLCERAEVSACRSPTCEACDEYAACFDLPARVPAPVFFLPARQATVKSVAV